MSYSERIFLSTVIEKELASKGSVQEDDVDQINAEIGLLVMESMHLREIFGIRKGVDVYSVFVSFQSDNLPAVLTCVRGAITLVLGNNA